MEIIFSFSVPKDETGKLLDDFFGQKLVEKTDKIPVHYHRKTEVSLDEGIILKQRLLIRESLQVFPTEIIIDLAEKVYDSGLNLAVTAAAGYIVAKFQGKLKKILFGNKEIDVNKDEIIKALLDEIKRLKESQSKQ